MEIDKMYETLSEKNKTIIIPKTKLKSSLDFVQILFVKKYY